MQDQDGHASDSSILSTMSDLEQRWHYLPHLATPPTLLSTSPSESLLSPQAAPVTVIPKDSFPERTLRQRTAPKSYGENDYSLDADSDLDDLPQQSISALAHANARKKVENSTVQGIVARPTARGQIKRADPPLNVPAPVQTGSSDPVPGPYFPPSRPSLSEKSLRSPPLLSEADTANKRIKPQTPSAPSLPPRGGGVAKPLPRASAPAKHQFLSMPTISANNVGRKKKGQTASVLTMQKKKMKRGGRIEKAPMDMAEGVKGHSSDSEVVPDRGEEEQIALPPRERKAPKRFREEQDLPNADRVKKGKRDGAKKLKNSEGVQSSSRGLRTERTISGKTDLAVPATIAGPSSAVPGPSVLNARLVPIQPLPPHQPPQPQPVAQFSFPPPNALPPYASPADPSPTPTSSPPVPASGALRAAIVLQPSDPSLPGYPHSIPPNPPPSTKRFPPVFASKQHFYPSLPALPTLPSRLQTNPNKTTPQKKSAALPPAFPKPKKPLIRTLHPALSSRDEWVECARDLPVTKAGRPPIWAEGRQELCESLEYYKSYQGGHYDLQERCLGYLLDGFPSASDRCEQGGRVIISHGGGCSSATTSSSSSSSRATYRLTASQTRSNLRMRALFNCLEHKVPVVVIAGSKWEFFPALAGLGRKGEGETRYAVLGHYVVTDIWAEGEPVEASLPSKGKQEASVGKGGGGGGTGKKEEDEGYHVRLKVRFEWVPGQGKGWFEEVVGGGAVGGGLGEKSSNCQPSQPEPPATPLKTFASTLVARTSSPDAALSAPSPLTSTSSVLSPLSLYDDPDSPMTDATSIVSDSEDEEESVGKESGGGDQEMVTCIKCAQTNRRIYREEIECYNEDCERFFLLDSVMPSPATLTYRPSLLSLTLPSSTSSLVPESLLPRNLQSLSGVPSISDYSWAAWRGFHCSCCGRLSSRAHWDVLKCAGCGFVVEAKGKVITGDDVRDGLRSEGKKGSGRRAAKEGKGKEKAQDSKSSGASTPFASLPHVPPPPSSAPGLSNRPLKPVSRLPNLVPVLLVRPGFIGYSVRLGPNAVVHHLWPVSSEGWGVADALFEEYQGDEAGGLFRRNGLSTHKTAGSLLCQQFSFNSGHHYVHAGKAATYPFAPDSASTSTAATPGASSSPASPIVGNEDTKQAYAPDCAKKARNYIQQAVELVVGKKEGTAFNEILSNAYMAGGRMNYHDDGERGLGPYVASLSLGTAAAMSWRPKLKKIKKKPAAGENVQTVENDEELTKFGTAKAPACLKIRLTHGDVCIMEGKDTQKIFEHMVEPEGGLRFAATARFISPEHLNPTVQSYKTTKYASGFEGSQPVPSRFAYQDAPLLSASTSLPPLPPAAQPPMVQTVLSRTPHLYRIPKPAPGPSQPRPSPSTSYSQRPALPQSSLAQHKVPSQHIARVDTTAPLYRKRVCPPPPLPYKPRPPAAPAPSPSAPNPPPLQPSSHTATLIVPSYPLTSDRPDMNQYASRSPASAYLARPHQPYFQQDPYIQQDHIQQPQYQQQHRQQHRQQYHPYSQLAAPSFSTWHPCGI
ncbi:hypothetical protein JCM11641_000543 [Rhodosporidiobolus odoratus]